MVSAVLCATEEEINPFSNSQIKSWRVPDKLFQRAKGQGNHTETVSALKGHKRRVQSVGFHPLSADVLVSTAMDLTIRLWDVTTSEEKV